MLTIRKGRTEADSQLKPAVKTIAVNETDTRSMQEHASLERRLVTVTSWRIEWVGGPFSAMLLSRPSTTLMLTLALGADASETYRLAAGSAECPCIDPHPVSGPGTADPGSGEAAAGSCTGILRGTTCYSLDYGARGCRAYDAGQTDECQSDEPPQWCLSKWCYVASWACLKPKHMNSFFNDVKTTNPTLLAAASATTTNGQVGDLDLLTYRCTPTPRDSSPRATHASTHASPSDAATRTHMRAPPRRPHTQSV